ncbi:MAG TPA: glutamyl-tRNA reductase [Candidatus Eisenbacteria bacterium]|nr:glutamyl-tRNA reductase [Candidatus Eisenbacteria bacterium]
MVLSHRRAPLSLRERFAYTPGEIQESLGRLVRQGIATEAVIVSTCHRIEVYIVSAGPPDPGRLGQFLCDDRGMSWAAVQPFARALAGLEVAEHLFRVTAGLDSMVVGEAEVLGQVKAAYAAAKQAGSLGPQIDGLFRWAIHAGRRVRKETELRTVHRSIGTRAVEVASVHLGGLHGRTVLILGAGRVARAVAERARAEAARVVICRRTAARARPLAGQAGEAVPLARLSQELADADVLVCCAAAQNRLVHREQLRHAVAGRQGRPLLVVDLSVPRVVDLGARHLPGIELIDLEGLAGEEAGDDPALGPAIRDGLAIVNQETRAFGAWAAGRQAGAVIVALRRRVDEICALELERLLRRNRFLSRAEAREVLRRALAKVLHAPTAAAREAVASGDYELISSLNRIFGLKDNPGLGGIRQPSGAAPDV